MLRWTSRVVDACPQFCLRCESKIKHILLSPGIAAGIVLVRCGHCGKLLGRVPSSYLIPEDATQPEEPQKWV